MSKIEPDPSVRRAGERFLLPTSLSVLACCSPRMCSSSSSLAASRRCASTTVALSALETLSALCQPSSAFLSASCSRCTSVRLASSLTTTMTPPQQPRRLEHEACPALHHHTRVNPRDLPHPLHHGLAVPGGVAADRPSNRTIRHGGCGSDGRPGDLLSGRQRYHDIRRTNELVSAGPDLRAR